MADFPIIFTGKDVSYEPRTTGSLQKASDRFQKTISDTERRKDSERQRGEEFFYETMDITPVQLMSEKLTGIQEQGINDFNDKWTLVYSNQGGTLTKAQQSEMFRDSKSLEAKQAQWMASQNKYERDWEMIKRDAGRSDPMLDQNAFTKASEAYEQTGHYDAGLQYTPINPGVYFSKNKLPGSGNRELTEEIVDGRKVTREVRVPGTDKQAKDHIANHIRQDMSKQGRLLQGIVEEFVLQPDEVKAPYLIDGPVDTPQEENAIIRWAQDYYSKYTNPQTETSKDRPATTSKSATAKKADRANQVIEGKVYDGDGAEVGGLYDDVDDDFLGKNKIFEFGRNTQPISISSKEAIWPKGTNWKVKEADIKVRPTRMGGGKVKYVTTSPITVTTTYNSYEDAPANVRSKLKAEGDKVTYTERIPSGVVVGTTIDYAKPKISAKLKGKALDVILNELPAAPAEEAPAGTDTWNNIKKGWKKIWSGGSPTQPAEGDIDFDQYKR